MLDERAQLFNISYGCSRNQVNNQQFFAMNLSSNMTEANRPLGDGVLLSSLNFPDFGNSSPNRLPSVRSSSTDSFNDPDGPAMNNGNGNCQTPDLDDSVYEDRPLGTPNSFIDEQAHSPDMFAERQRLVSTSSSFTYSPYSPYEESAIGLSHGLDRQTSLAIVEEVLGSAEECPNPLMFFPKDDTPLLDTNEDSCLPPYPSPSFVEHFNANNNLAEKFITSSQGEEFYATFSGTDGPSGYQCDGSPATESSPAANSNNNSCNEAQSSNAQETTVTCTEETGSIQYLQQAPFTCTSALERQTTNLSDIITNSMPHDSLDASAMMQDFYNTLPSSQSQITTVSVELLAETPITESSSHNGRLNIENPSTSATPQSQTTLENCNNTSTDSDKNETDIANARRERNNAACRQSRKRRKEKKLDLEHQADFFAKENDQLRVKIEELEIECKRVKQSIMSVMSQNMNRNTNSR